MLRIIFTLIHAISVFATALSARDETCTDGITTTSNGRKCNRSCGVDHPGGDYLPAQHTGNFSSCIELCSKDKKCATAQFLTTTGNCYLKDHITSVRNNTKVNTVICPDPPPGGWPAPPPPIKTSCVPGYSTQQGRKVVNQCGVRYGKTTDNGQNVASMADCANLCAGNSSCWTATYQQNTTFCHLTSSGLAPLWAEGEDSSLFYNTSATPVAGCSAADPPSPYLLNPGFELGQWGLGGDVSLPGQKGTFYYIYTYQNGFEGCQAFALRPGSDGPYRFAPGVEYKNLEIGKPYQASVYIGQRQSSSSYESAPQYSVYLDGKNVTSAYACGYSNTKPCPVNGTGGAIGQQIITNFTAGNSSGMFSVYLVWANAAGGDILLDGFSLKPL